MKPSLSLFLTLLALTAGSAHAAIIWNGSADNMTWEVGGNNWLADGSAAGYQMNDDVAFAENGAGTVTISGSVGGGSMTVTGGTYTFTNAASSGLTTAANLTLSNNAQVTFTDTQNLTGSATLDGTSTLTINRETLANLQAVTLAEGTRFEISNTELQTGGLRDLVNKVTGAGTIALNLRTDGNNYTNVTFSDNFLGTAEIHGTLWAGSAMKNVAGVKMTAGSSLMLKDSGSSVTCATPIEIAGNTAFRVMESGKDLTLTGAITGGSGYTITKNGVANLYLNGDMSDFTGKVIVSEGKVFFGQGVKSSGSLTVNSGKAAEYGNDVQVTLAPNGELLADGGTITFGSNVQVTGGKLRCGTAGANIVARPTSGSGTVTYSNVTVTSGESVKGNAESGPGLIADGLITVTRGMAFNLENVQLVNSLVSLSGSGAVTLKDVTLGKGSSISRAQGNACTLNLTNVAITLESAHVTNAAENHRSPLTLSYDLGGNANVSGSLTLAFDKELMLDVGKWSGDIKHVDLTLTGVATWDTNTTIDFDAYSQYFDPHNVTVNTDNLATGGTVLVSVDFGRPIPEPSAAGLGLLGAAAFLLRRRRRRRD